MCYRAKFGFLTAMLPIAESPVEKFATLRAPFQESLGPESNYFHFTGIMNSLRIFVEICPQFFEL